MSLRNGEYFPLPDAFCDPQRASLTKFFVRTDSFPSSTAFELINSALQSDDAERQDAVKKGQSIFAFTLKNEAGATESWYIDLKDKGAVGTGEAPEGKKADGRRQS